MAAFFRTYSEQAYALMRIVSGFLFACHGSQKLFGFPAPAHEAPLYITYGAGSIELIGGVLIALGLFTGWAAFICSGQMAVAYWMKHGTRSVLPLNNGGELAALYCFLFLCIAARGGGIWSLDARASGAGSG
jgi:putative oxidoreductase